MTSWSFQHAQVQGHLQKIIKVPAFVGNHDVLREHHLGRSFQTVIHGLSHLIISYPYAPCLVHLSIVYLHLDGYKTMFTISNTPIYHFWIYSCGACKAPYPHLENLGHQHVRVGSCLKCWSHHGFQYENCHSRLGWFGDPPHFEKPLYLPL